MRSIGGKLDYARLAQMHRPTDTDALAREARRLTGDGLSVRDVAMALNVSAQAVEALLRERAA